MTRGPSARGARVRSEQPATTDGCETDTTDNDDHCGACNVVCTGSQQCCGTRCGIVNLLGICL